MTTHETHWSPAVRALVARAKAEALREAMDIVNAERTEHLIGSTRAPAAGPLFRVEQRLRACADSLAAQPAPEAAMVDDVARTLIAAWEQAEGKPVNPSYVATHADMARAVLATFDVRRKP